EWQKSGSERSQNDDAWLSTQTVFVLLTGCRRRRDQQSRPRRVKVPDHQFPSTHQPRKPVRRKSVASRRQQSHPTPGDNSTKRPTPNWAADENHTPNSRTLLSTFCRHVAAQLVVAFHYQSLRQPNSRSSTRSRRASSSSETPARSFRLVRRGPNQTSPVKLL